MRLDLGPGTSPRRWRRARTARIVVAAMLVLAAPFVDRAGSGAGADPAHTDPAHTDPSLPDTAAGAAGRGPVRLVPVPLADPAVADLLQPGDLVDLVGTADPDAPGGPALVTRGARVTGSPAGRGGARSILVEVPESDAARLAATAAGTPLAVVVHG